MTCFKQSGCDMKKNWFEATVESVLVFGATSWPITKSLKKAIDGAYTRILRVVLNISEKQHSTKNEFYSNIPPVSSTIRDRRLRFAGYRFRSKREFASGLVLWQPLHSLRTLGRPIKTFADKLAGDMDCQTWDLKNLTNDRRKEVIACWTTRSTWCVYT